MNKIEFNKYAEELSKVTIKCKCSHTMVLPFYVGDIKICTWCGRKVYRNDKAKFKDILIKKLQEV